MRDRLQSRDARPSSSEPVLVKIKYGSKIVRTEPTRTESIKEDFLRSLLAKRFENIFNVKCFCEKLGKVPEK